MRYTYYTTLRKWEILYIIRTVILVERERNPKSSCGKCITTTRRRKWESGKVAAVVADYVTANFSMMLRRLRNK